MPTACLIFLLLWHGEFQAWAAAGRADDLLAIAQRVVQPVQEAMHADNFLHYRNFGTWSYEGGTITRGLWELQDQLPQLDLEHFLHSHLDYFLDSPDEFGYSILRNISLAYNDTLGLLPWLYSIGDTIGLFPIVYADRLSYAQTRGNHTEEEDRYIVSEVVDKYIYGYPWHLPDGTISRPITWPAEGLVDPRGGGVWVDDMYMGTALLVQQAALTQDVSYLLEAGKQVLHIATILQDKESGLFKHGYHYWTDHHSCCYWGRGNGWALMSVTEVLEAWEAMSLAEAERETYERLLEVYRNHIAGLLSRQLESGLWSNILTNPSTFAETSASAMFMTGLSRGVRFGWLKDDLGTRENIARTWQSIQLAIYQDGTIARIIGGTGIKNEESGYDPENTAYENAAPGVGAVLRAIAELVKLEAQHTNFS